MQKIVFNDLEAQYAHLKKEIDAGIASVIEGCHFISGPQVEELEKALCAYTGRKYCVTVSSGTDALLMPLMAWGIHEGDAVFVPGFTFFATAEVVSLTGATPVFCDIREDDYTLDPEKLEALITEETSAIVPVHVYGNLCQTDAIQEIADRHGLKVIYDAAHTFGVEVNGRSAASFGDASMFSFHATKVYHTIEGGAVAYRDPALAHEINGLKNFGILDEETVALVGGNGKMNEFQAAMGLCNLRHVEQEIEKRRRVYERYRERLSGVDGIRLCPKQPGVKMNYAYMPVVFEGYRLSRDEVFARLTERDIHPRKYFYPCVNAYQCYKDRFSPEDTPIAARISREILTLPMYADLPVETVDEICDIILE